MLARLQDGTAGTAGRVCLDKVCADCATCMCCGAPGVRVQGEPAAVLELVAHEEGKGYVLGAGISSPFAFHLGWITALIKHKEW